MEALATLTDGTDARQKLAGLVTRYRDWIARTLIALIEQRPLSSGSPAAAPGP